jgi:putative toxin-antitoxin system antitoxin component (TIGR02293 family)
MTTAAHPRASSPLKDTQPQDNRRAVWDILFRRHPEARPRRVRGEIKHFVFISNDVAHAIVREGVSGQVLAPLGDLLGLGPTQLAPVIGVDRTTARRYARDDQTLPKHSGETVLRLAELEGLALDVFASAKDAHGWLRKPHPMLGESPIDAASTSYGAQHVREILTAIKYGGVV